ncbi:hypothetical protein DYU05_16185 [Mucilaginibacter terrenus]|uniref:Uncharacterized protein n=1 Tax=Mucilaginibacter terrenus TaxID=2482727 RepID=A0A3E2NMF4_9SPHI|nr:hypothetical protein [Mucilaginibacter terrenus]RFZ82158.1 hypothetical protein DYU05_16185 [Mucilaginibacter terrenus]
MKASQIAAKAVVRVFFALILLALVMFINGDRTKLQHIYLAPKHLYTLVAPLLLIIGFITLLVLCSVKKYTKPDLNWLLVVNTVVLLVYLGTLFFAVQKLLV